MAETRLAEAIRHKSALSRLIQTEGWKVFDKELQDREALHLNDLMNPHATDNEMRDYRAALRNTTIIRTIPAELIEQAALVIETHSKDEEDG